MLYVDQDKEFLQRLVREPRLQKEFFLMYGENIEPSSGETQNSGNLGKLT